MLLSSGKNIFLKKLSSKSEVSQLLLEGSPLQTNRSKIKFWALSPSSFEIWTFLLTVYIMEKGNLVTHLTHK